MPTFTSKLEYCVVFLKLILRQGQMENTSETEPASSTCNHQETSGEATQIAGDGRLPGT